MWGRAADAADAMDLSELKPLRARAGQLRGRLDRVIHAADERLAGPPIGGTPIGPLGADWVHRPAPFARRLSPPGLAGVASGTAFGPELVLFHDSTRPELSLRQIRNRRAGDRGPFGLLLEVFGFDGGFLSLVFEPPPGSVAGLRRRHLVRLAGMLETESPLEPYARLNVRHGPNTAQIVRKLPSDPGEVAVDFDLAYADFNEARVERMWVDLIFDRPAMTRITLRDVTLSRRPRAEL